MKNQIAFLWDIHYFRAFTIVNIVFVHVWRLPIDKTDPLSFTIVNSLRELAFHGSTIYFLFISGFLFHHLSPKFTLSGYYKSKIQNVKIPYLFWTSFILIVVMVFFDSELSEPSFLQLLEQIGYALLFGSAQLQYWYIPFIALVFLFSPLLLKIPNSIFEKIALSLCVLPLLGSRTGASVSLSQYLYFLPVYLLGMYVSMNYSKIMTGVHKYWKIIAAVTITASLMLILVHFLSFDPKWINIKESLYYVQKISIVFLALYLLKELQNKRISLLDSFARYSFAIFFTHYFLNYLLFDWYYDKLLPVASATAIFYSLFYAVLILFLNLFICMVLKGLLGRQSRYILGA